MEPSRVQATGAVPVVLEGIGFHVPEQILTNDELSRRVDTSDEWIRTRTGIRERRIADSTEMASDLGAKAAQAALADAGIEAKDIDMIIVATTTPDMLFPASAAIIQDKLGLSNIPAFDVIAACSGFLYAMELGRHLLRGSYERILIIGSEKLSTITDWEDRATCVLFGDGAGAAVLARGDDPGFGIIDCQLGTNGSEAAILNMPAGGSARPPSVETIENREHFLRMTGREVFKHAVRVMGQAATDVLGANGLTPDDVKCVISHQANIRIIEAIADRLKMPIEKFPMNLQRYGNTSAASIPIMMVEAREQGAFQKGDAILLVSFGAGLTWAASLLRWHQ